MTPAAEHAFACVRDQFDETMSDPPCDGMSPSERIEVIAEMYLHLARRQGHELEKIADAAERRRNAFPGQPRYSK